MQRRRFLQICLGAAAALPAAGWTAPLAEMRSFAPAPRPARGSFALDGNRIQFFVPGLARSFRVLMLADTHLFLDDARGESFRDYSARMAKAYNQTRHAQTGALTHPQEAFEQTLERARKNQAELILLGGDIFSFPSEAALEWALGRLQAAGIPWQYIAGNHDWHYEGMPGSLQEQRATWTGQRLRPLYQGNDPLMAARDLHGVRFVSLDNSTYEILPAQLAFYRRQARSGRPLVLLMHIPLYAPGRHVGYGCGHPDWNAAHDRGAETERRPRWPASGPSRTTLAFHREVFATPNLLGILAGHMHRPSLDVVNGLPQFVVEANCTGGSYEIELVPAGTR